MAGFTWSDKQKLAKEKGRWALRAPKPAPKGFHPLHPSGRTSLTMPSGNYRQLIGWGLTCNVLQKYAATQKMTGNEQARSGHFCLCGYAAKAAMTSASRRHFCRGGCKKVWQRTHASLGSVCAAGRGLRSNPEKTGRWLVELARTRQLLDFSLAPDGSLQLSMG